MFSKLKLRFLFALKRATVALLPLAALIGMVCAPALAEVETNFLFSLSNFGGRIPFNWANVAVDKARNEIYVADARLGEIRIFNKKGMEIYRFGDDGNFDTIVDVAVKSDGGILVLSRSMDTHFITLCNFKGEILIQKFNSLRPHITPNLLASLHGLPEMSVALCKPPIVLFVLR